MTNNPNDAVPSASQPAGYGSSAPYSSGPVAGEKKTLSLISMITGILGVLLIITTWPAILLGIAAVVLGHLGQRREKVAGKGFWVTGLITGYLAIVGGVIWLIVSIAIFAALQSGEFGNVPTY